MPAETGALERRRVSASLEPMTRVPIKRMLLLDGIGASLSALMLGVVLPRMHDWIGMPAQALGVLCLIATAYALFSLCCPVFSSQPEPTWLRVIMFANIAYALVIAALLLIHLEEMQPLGIAYFLADLGVMFLVIRLEKNCLASHAAGG